MEPIEVAGKTVDEAVQTGLSSLGLRKDQVEIEVIDEGSRGFLGLVGFRHARVRIRALNAGSTSVGDTASGRTCPRPRLQTAQNASALPEDGSSGDVAGQRGICVRGVDADHGYIDRRAVDEGDLSCGAKFLEGLVSVMGLDAEVREFPEEDITMLEVEGKSLGVLIGRHGETLDSIQYLVNLAANRAIRASGEEERVRYVVDVAGYRRKREETLRAMAVEATDKVIEDRKKQILEPMSALERRIVHMALKDVNGVVTHSEGREPYRRIVISPTE
ncbi:MAG TPA: RNA-binding cell elongation regulator Jag/EloR [Bacillota bacterium]|nr:RNA-binding cell elongation regulator Jag/EloR [Bacillota bacterium]